MTQDEGQRTRDQKSVTRSAAASLVDTALELAEAAGFQAAIAVVDEAGVLRAFQRADGAPFLTADIAINKAWTAASLGHPTHVWNALTANPGVAPLANLPRVIAVGGGYPLKENGKVVGGFAISGGTTQQDQDAACEAMRRLGFDVP